MIFWGLFMRIGKYVSLVITLFLMCDPSRADFKYTQQSKVTGGALVGMTKTLGVFSKNMRQVTEPQTSTTMLKGKQLREELAAVERAEERLMSGTYGLSIDSGEPIPDERLEAVPTAERTVEEERRLHP